MSLINWNPDKGDPSDYHPVMTDVLVPRKEIEASRTKIEADPSPRAEAEKQLLEQVEYEDALDDGEEYEVVYEGACGGCAECENEEDYDEDEDVEIESQERPRRELRPLVGRWRCFYQIELVATLDFKQADGLLDLEPWDREEDDQPTYKWSYFQPRSLTVRLSYPLETAHQFTVPPYKRIIQWPGEPSSEQEHMTPGYLLWVIAREYKHIYGAYEEYGVWGHTLSDLHFEGIEIDEEGNVELYIGS